MNHRARALRLRGELADLLDARLCARTDRVANARDILHAADALLDAEEAADAALVEAAP